MLDRIPHRRHRRQVRHRVRLVLLKELQQQRRIPQVPLREREIRLTRQIREMPLLMNQRIVIVHTVQADHAVPAREQRLRQSRTHKPRHPGNKNIHPAEFNEEAVLYHPHLLYT